MNLKAAFLFACSISLTSWLAGAAFASENTGKNASADFSSAGRSNSSHPGLSNQPSTKPPANNEIKKSSLIQDEIRKQAQFHTSRREFAEAIPLWSKLAQKSDAQAEAYLGWSHLQLGEKDKAVEHINRAIALNPRTVEGHRYLGYYLIGEGKVPEAVKAFRTSMSFDPHHKCNCGDLEKLVLSKSKHKRP